MEDSFLIKLSLILGAMCWAMKIIPFIFFKNKVNNKFLNSFLYYIPFAIMTSMVIPEVFHSTSSLWSAAFGVLVTLILGFLDQNLLVISLLSTASVFVFERFLKL